MGGSFKTSVAVGSL